MNLETLAAKQSLRRQMTGMRESLSHEQAEQWSRQIASQLMASQLIHDFAERHPPCGIGLFMAMRQEADLSFTWQNLRSRGFNLCFPRMTAIDGRPDLEFLAIPEKSDPQAMFRTSRFGVREPAAPDLPGNATGMPVVVPCEPEIILLPGLAFDRHGHRLGWGKGYYDHYLARRAQSGGPAPICLGVAYPFQIIEQVPATEQDIPVDYLLSPDGIICVR